MNDDHDLDLLTLSQLKQIASAQAQPYRVHAQVEHEMDGRRARGAPYVEMKLVDAGIRWCGVCLITTRCFWMRVSSLVVPFIELAAQWMDTG
jgi:3'-5' exoribonuclease